MRLRLLAAILLASLALVGCARSAEPPRPTDGPGALSETAQLISRQCTVCHNVDRIKSASHDEAAWGETVTRMRGKGAVLTDDEAQEVIGFLSSGGGSEL